MDGFSKVSSGPPYGDFSSLFSSGEGCLYPGIAFGERGRDLTFIGKEAIM